MSAQVLSRRALNQFFGPARIVLIVVLGLIEFGFGCRQAIQENTEGAISFFSIGLFTILFGYFEFDKIILKFLGVTLQAEGLIKSKLLSDAAFSELVNKAAQEVPEVEGLDPSIAKEGKDSYIDGAKEGSQAIFVSENIQGESENDFEDLETKIMKLVDERNIIAMRINQLGPGVENSHVGISAHREWLKLMSTLGRFDQQIRTLKKTQLGVLIKNYTKAHEDYSKKFGAPNPLSIDEVKMMNFEGMKIAQEKVQLAEAKLKDFRLANPDIY